MTVHTGQLRRQALDAAVKASFETSGGIPETYGSPRVWEDLVADGWKVSKKSVAASMARQGLQGLALGLGEVVGYVAR